MCQCTSTIQYIPQINVAMQTAENAIAPHSGRIAGIQMAAANRTREAVHVEDQVAGTHHQLLGAESVAAAITATR